MGAKREGWVVPADADEALSRVGRAVLALQVGLAVAAVYQSGVLLPYAGSCKRFVVPECLLVLAARSMLCGFCGSSNWQQQQLLISKQRVGRVR